MSDNCEHHRQMQKQTYVQTQSRWIESSLAWLCLDCGATGIRTPKEAFFADNVKRKTVIIRDDRTDAERQSSS